MWVRIPFIQNIVWTIRNEMLLADDSVWIYKKKICVMRNWFRWFTASSTMCGWWSLCKSINLRGLAEMDKLIFWIKESNRSNNRTDYAYITTLLNHLFFTSSKQSTLAYCILQKIYDYDRIRKIICHVTSSIFSMCTCGNYLNNHRQHTV